MMVFLRQQQRNTEKIWICLGWWKWKHRRFKRKSLRQEIQQSFMYRDIMFVFLIIIKNKEISLLDSNYLPKRATSAFGDWIKVDRLLSGALESQYFYFFKLSEK